jgi:hypothetical protein
MNMSRDRGPRYSLEYLTFIATKRKQREAGGDREEGTKADWEGGGSASAPQVVAPTVAETMKKCGSIDGTRRTWYLLSWFLLRISILYISCDSPICYHLTICDMVNFGHQYII